MRSLYHAAVLGTVAVVFGCGKSNVTPESGTPPSKATYSYLSKNVFEAKCTMCHNAVKARAKVDLSSYDGLIASAGMKQAPIVAGSPEKSAVYIEVSQQKMPPALPALRADELKALSDWINAGALEKTPGFVLVKPAPGAPNPPKPTYEWLIANSLRSCTSCHGLPAKSGGIDFTSYATLLASTGEGGKALVPGDAAASGIYHETSGGDMPPERHGLTDEEIKLVSQWITEGAKNN